MPTGSPTYKRLNRLVGRALHQYNMIEDGDRILVGLSGGKDSLTLMWTLSERRNRVPTRYEISALYIDPGFDGGFGEALTDYCQAADYCLRVEYTDFGLKAHSPENRENPCFLCSWNRRKRIFEIADSLGCNKIALGHHKDDLIETLFVNMFYAGEITTMMPLQPFFNGLLTVIRPLALVDEALIERFAVQQGFPTFVNPCPSARRSARKQVKDMLKGLYRTNNKIKGNIFRAMRHVHLNDLLK